jgi:hypothetical protein
MRRFITISLGVVIIILLFRNAEVIRQIIKTTTDIFGKSFKAVTSVGEFK